MIHVQLEGKGNNFCLLFDSNIQDNNLRAYMNMIKYWALVLFDMPACHAWAHKQRIFDTPLKHYSLRLTDQKGL